MKILLHHMHRAIPGLALSAFLISSASAADWTLSDIQLLHGNTFQEPFNANDVGVTTVTVNHARGYSWGRTFFFADYTKADAKGGREEGLYGELYGTFSLSKLSGRALKAGILKDVNVTMGVNYGENTNGANPRVLLPGVTFDLDVPGFAYFNVDVLAFIDRGRFNGADTTCNADTYQITPVWKRPFKVGNLSMSFDGFADIIGAHGTCARQVLTQPQLRLDVGEMFGNPDTLYVGVEYQYWKNKFGISGLNDHLPQALLLMQF